MRPLNRPQMRRLRPQDYQQMNRTLRLKLRPKQTRKHPLQTLMTTVIHRIVPKAIPEGDRNVSESGVTRPHNPSWGGQQAGDNAVDNLGGRPWVLFDADCGFCTASVRFMQRPLIRADVVAEPFQTHDLAARGLNSTDCAATLHVLADAKVYTGAAAIARVLRASRTPWPVLGVLLRVPGLSQLAELLYRIVARNRHRLPGATASCEMPHR